MPHTTGTVSQQQHFCSAQDKKKLKLPDGTGNFYLKNRKLISYDNFWFSNVSILGMIMGMARYLTGASGNFQ